MRCFVAVKIPDAVRALVRQVQDALRRAEADVLWVEPRNLHVTLKFLGEIAEEQAARLRPLLAREAMRGPRLAVEFAGVGRFPEVGSPRVLWVGCRGDVERLAALAGAVEREAEAVGVPRESRPFRAHLTIGRVKSPRNARRLLSALESRKDACFGAATVEEFHLFQSTLTSRGPIHEILETFPRGASGG